MREKTAPAGPRFPFHHLLEDLGKFCFSACDRLETVTFPRSFGKPVEPIEWSQIDLDIVRFR